MFVLECTYNKYNYGEETKDRKHTFKAPPVHMNDSIILQITTQT